MGRHIYEKIGEGTVPGCYTVDEGEIYQSQDYNTVLKNKNYLRRTIQTLFGAVVSPLLEEYAAVIGEETELECRHFFEQGYLMGLAEGANPF